MDKKKYVMLVASAALSVVAADAQSLIGSWNGKLDVGAAALNLVFHVGSDNKVTMDSPDQGAMGIETTTRCLTADSINVELPALQAQFSAKLSGDELRGTFTQMGYSFPLNMKRGEVKLIRPQTPVPPFDYTTEEVSFENSGSDPLSGKQSEAGGARLSGTLTLPAGFKKGMPVVLMVTGSGQQNRDEELMGHKPFLVIADYLARHGIATLRYDDRGTAKSTGDFAKATTYDNMLDAEAGVSYLRKTGKFGRIGVLGHSEGGSIAFMLAAKGNADFVVALAAPALPGDSILIAQNRYMLQMAGLDGASLDTYTKALGRILQNLKSGRKSRFSTPEAVVASLTLDLQIPEELKQVLVEAYKMADNAWMKYFLAYNPGNDISKLECPAMMLFAEKDMQVSAAANAPVARQLIPEKIRQRSQVKEYPGLNHLFQPSATGMPMEYGKIETTISEAVIADIAAWIAGESGK